jgi:hypothetical protein
MLRMTYIAWNQYDLTPFAFDQRLYLGSVLILVQIGDDDICSFARVGDRDGTADAAIATGDDRLLAGETPRAFLALLAVVGPRFHRARRAGHQLLLGGEGRLGIFGHMTTTPGSAPVTEPCPKCS